MISDIIGKHMTIYVNKDKLMTIIYYRLYDNITKSGKSLKGVGRGQHKKSKSPNFEILTF